MLEVPWHIFGMVDHLPRHFDLCFLGNLLEIQNQLWLAIFGRLQTTNKCHSNFWSAEVSCKFCNFAPKNGCHKTVKFFAPSAQQLIQDLRRHCEDPRQHFLGLWEWGDCIHYHLLAQDFLFHWRTTPNQLLIYFSFSMENVTPRTIQNSLYLLFDKILSQPVFPF